MTTCLVISNPASRHSLDEQRLGAVLDVARDTGWEVRAVATEREQHATEIARNASADGADVIVVAGGDGTINETINGIAGTSTALATIPGGTANVWAREIRMERDPIKAMRQIVHGERRRIDVGRADGRCFLLMAGIGFDAEIVPRVSGRMKRRLGAAAFVAAGAGAMFRARGRAVEMRIDGRALPADTELFWMLVGNTRSYGGITDIMYRAEADDGLLDIALMQRGGVRRLVADGIRVLRKRHQDSRNIDYVKARAVAIDTPGLPVQLDGEFWGRTPMRFEVWPQALTVIVPHGLETPLLRAHGMVAPDAL